MADLQQRLQAALTGRYTIEREVGRGGMAVVVLAQDAKHRRRVAIKILRPELAAVLGPDRFLREIEIAARLTHPHILPLYDSGEVDGLLYYVMPYVEGESLRDRLSREKQLPIADALAIAQEVADALTYAHSHDVVHRDIKPENILLEAGHAVVSDFGIARAISAAGGERLTQTGIAVGTPTYMGPEQAAGEPQVDGRSDIYSLGCVLYEMLAGGPPFVGPSAQVIAARHAVDPVPPLRTVRNTVSVAVERAINRALAKVPADRFVTAGAFAAALEEAITAPSEPEAMVVAVQRLPRRRWTLMGLGALAMAAGATVTLRVLRPPVYVPGRVVVAPLENHTGQPALDDLTRHFGAMLPDAIAREGVGEPVAAATVRDLLARAAGSPGQVAQWLARETSAGLELRGACSRAAQGTTCQVDVLRMPAKVLRMSMSVTGDPEQPAFQAELTERALVALFLQRTWGDRVTWLGEYLPRSLAAVRAFKQGYDGREWKYMGEAARLDTAWVEAAVWATWDSSDAAAESALARLARRPGLLEGDRETVAFALAGRRGDGEQCFALARRRFAVNPEWWVTRLTIWATITGRATVALAVSRYADSALHPEGGRDWPSYMRGYALHQLGQYQEELELAHDLQRRFPTAELLYRTHEAMALGALGEVDSLRRRLTDWEATPEPSTGSVSPWAGSRAFIAAEELMAHGKEREGREVLSATLPLYRRLRKAEGCKRFDCTNEVVTLLWTDQPEEARRLAVGALRIMTSPADSLVYLGLLGSIAARQGRGDEAARYDRLLAAAGQRPRLNGRAAAERAGIASLLGDREGAVRFLEEARAVGAGNAVWHTYVHRDPALAGLRDYVPFQRFLKPRD